MPLFLTFNIIIFLEVPLKWKYEWYKILELNIDFNDWAGLVSKCKLSKLDVIFDKVKLRH